MADIGRWGVIDNLAGSFYRVSPYNYGLNNPIYFSDHTGNGPVAFIYYEIRAIIPILEELGITAAFTGTIMLDLDSGEGGLSFGESIGPSGGAGLFAGPGAGVFWNADGIDDLNGFGANFGIASSVPGIANFGFERNFSFTDSGNKDGLSVASPWGSRGFGAGGYVEGSATMVKKFGNVYLAVNSAIDGVLTQIENIKSAIELMPPGTAKSLVLAQLEELKWETEKARKELLESATEVFDKARKEYKNRKEGSPPKKNDRRIRRRFSDLFYSEEFLRWWYGVDEDEHDD